MWEYNRMYGNATSGILMHKDHKYIDKVRTAGGKWRYIYDTAKGGVSKAGRTVANGIKEYNQVSNNISGQIGRNISPKVGSAVANTVKSGAKASIQAQRQQGPSKSAYDQRTEKDNLRSKEVAAAQEREKRRATQQTHASTAQAIKEDKAARENAPAKKAIEKSLVAMKRYESAYTAINNASEFPVMYKDPKSGRTVTVTNERSRGLALRNIMNEMNSMETEINRTLSGVNPDDPDISRYITASKAYMAQYKKRLANSKLPARPTTPTRNA